MRSKVWFLLWVGVFIWLFSGCGSNQLNGSGVPGTGINAGVVFTPYPPMPGEPSATGQTSGSAASKNSLSLSLSSGWSTVSFPFDALVSTGVFSYGLQYYAGGNYYPVNPASDAATMDCRLGYWAYTVSAAAIPINGSDTAGISSVTLQSGWNLIAFPLRANKTFADLTLTSGGETKPLGQACSFSTDPGSAWLYGIIQYYKNNRWYQLKYDNAANALQTWKGYWVFSWQDGLILNFFPIPALSSLSPVSGPPGTTVTISGNNFGGSQGASAVSFNGVNATCSSWSNTSIVCLAPNGATSGPVTVRVGNSTSNALTFTFVSPLGDYFVNGASGDDGNDGSMAHPFKTVTKAVSVAGAGNIVCVATGTYVQPEIWLQGVKLRGGYNSDFSVYNFKLFPTILDANYGSKVVSITSGEVKGFDIQHGSCGDWGGGISVYNPGPTSISDCIIHNNNAGGGPGGGIMCYYSSPVITNCLICWNVCQCGYCGGGISAYGGSPIIRFCTIRENVATAWGGGIDVEDGSGNTVVDHCIVNFNTSYVSPGPGGGVYSTATFHLTYTDIQGNRPNEVSKYMSGGTLSDLAGWGWDGTGCFSADPQFVNSNDRDFHLLPGSLCINAGNPLYQGDMLSGFWETQAGVPDTGIVDPGFHYPVVHLASIRVTPALPATLGFGQTRQFSAQGLYTDGTLRELSNQVNWSFNNAGAGAVSSAGLFTAVGSGSGTQAGVLTASMQGVTGNAVSITVRMISPPQINSLSPGSALPGETVTIYGQHLGSTQGSSILNLGDSAIPAGNILLWNDNQVVFIIPAGAAPGSLFININGVIGNSYYLFFTPQLSGIDPVSAPVGSRVTLNGANLGSPGTVSFNGATAGVISWSSGQIICQVPSGASSGPLSVTSDAGFSSNAVNFTLLIPPQIDSLTPSSGRPGDTITISGVHFGALQMASTISFNGILADSLAWSDLQITCQVPAGALTGLLTVTTSQGPSNQVLFAIPPRIIDLSPASGGTGATVTVTGSYFGAAQGSSTVTLNGMGIPPQSISWSDSQLVFTIPFGAQSGSIIIIVAGQASNPATFTVNGGSGGSGSIYAGYAHSLLVKNDSTVWDWGSDQMGQLGDNNQADGTRFNPVQVKAENGADNISGISQAALGDYSTLLLKLDGGVLAMGYNRYGQLGDGTRTDHYLPAPVKDVGGVGNLSGITAIASHRYSCLALKGSDGSVWAWGSKIGGNNHPIFGTYYATPVAIPGESGGSLTGASAIAVSSYGDFALALKNGQVLGWGRNNSGQLGNGNYNSSDTPAWVVGENGSGLLSGISSISCGQSHGLALRNDGTVWAWGYNPEGELGNGTYDSSNTPVQVLGENAEGFLGGITAISAGGYHNLALKSDGTLLSWGYNGNGQLGTGNTDQRNVPGPVLMANGSPLSGVVAFSGGLNHSLAMRNDGSIWAWGGNGFGQLGNGSYNGSYYPNPVNGYTPPLTALSVSPDSKNDLLPTQTLQLSATGTYSGGIPADLTNSVAWSCDNPSAGSVNTAGLFTASGFSGSFPQTAHITASLGGFSSSSTIEVGVDSLTISPEAAEMLPEDGVNFTVTARHGENEMNASGKVAWSCDNPSAGSVDSNGNFYSVDYSGTFPQYAVITASGGGLQATAQVDVGIDRIDITQERSALMSGQYCWFEAQVVHGDHSQYAWEIQWSCDNPLAGSMMDWGPGMEGYFQAADASGSFPQTTNVIATLGGVSGSVSLTVEPVASISVTPKTLKLYPGQATQFSCTGLNAAQDNSIDLTGSVTWSCDNADAGAFDNSSGHFVATGPSGSFPQAATISAAYGHLQGDDCDLSVAIDSITVAPASAIVWTGLTKQFTVTGYTNGTPIDLTSQVTWQLGDPDLGSFDGSGLFTAAEVDGTYETTLTAVKDGMLSNEVPLTVTSVPVPGMVKWRYQGDSRFEASPAIGLDGSIYGIQEGGRFMAFNPDGTIKWSSDMGGNRMEGGASVGSDGNIYVCSDYGPFWGSLYCLNPADGSVNWNYQTQGDMMMCTPAIGSNGKIYFADRFGTLYCLNADGTESWLADFYGSEGSPALAADGTIYIMGCNAWMYAFNPDGSPKWSVNPAIWENSAPPAIGSDGTIYFDTADGSFTALNPADGSTIWQTQIDGNHWSSPAIGVDGTIYVGGGNSLWAMNPDGSIKWHYTVGDGVQSSPAIDANGNIYFNSYDYNFYCVKPDGTLKWLVNGGPSQSSPVITSDNMVYVGSNWEILAICAEGPLANSQWPMFMRNPQHTGR